MAIKLDDETSSVSWEHDMTALIKKFVTDETGATAIEYALIASGIALAIIAGISATSGSINNMYSTVTSTVTTTVGG